MKNDEKTSRAATHAAMTIAIAHLASTVDADDVVASSHPLVGRMKAQGTFGSRRDCALDVLESDVIPGEGSQPPSWTGRRRRVTRAAAFCRTAVPEGRNADRFGSGVFFAIALPDRAPSRDAGTSASSEPSSARRPSS